MRVAVVGGGFYGCYIAKELKKKFGSSVNIDIYDRSKELLSRAATNNQCRLHLGFHYPRSADTIRQTISGFNDFISDFKECVDFPSQNYYAIHKDSCVDFKQYLVAMDEHNLNYEIKSKSTLDFFKNNDDIEGIIRVSEGVIRLKDLASNLLSRLDANIFTESVVSKIDPTTGELVVNGKLKTGYDIIINSTYTDSNLGLPFEQKFDLKYELTAMVLLDAPFGDDVALTVMDGPFVSLYPAGNGMATLSSVTHTPFLNLSTTAELEKKLSDINKKPLPEHIVNNILRHGNQYLNLELSARNVKEVWISPKTKVLQDEFDQRLTEIRKYKKLISVLCGKLDAVHCITDKIIEAIEAIEAIEEV